MLHTACPLAGGNKMTRTARPWRVFLGCSFDLRSRRSPALLQLGLAVMARYRSRAAVSLLLAAGLTDLMPCCHGARNFNGTRAVAIAVTNDNSRAVVLGGAGPESVSFIDTSTNTPTVVAVDSLSTAPTDVAVTPDGRLAIVRAGAALDGIVVYRTDTGARVLTLGENTGCGRIRNLGIGHVHCIAVTADSSRAVVLG